MLIVKHRGEDSSKKKPQRTQMESELSDLIILTFEEQSCLILDSISNPVFIIQILDFICRFHSLGLPDILWIELNEHTWTELNKYNKREFTKMRTKWTTNTVTFWLAIAVAKLHKEMQASPCKMIIKRSTTKASNLYSQWNWTRWTNHSSYWMQKII